MRFLSSDDFAELIPSVLAKAQTRLQTEQRKQPGWKFPKRVEQDLLAIRKQQYDHVRQITKGEQIDHDEKLEDALMRTGDYLMKKWADDGRPIREHKWDRASFRKNSITAK